MKRMTTVLRELLAKDGVLVYPGIYDPLTAQIAERLGFKLTGIGGNSMGSRLCVSEPLLSLEDLVRQVRHITAAINIPLKVDAGAGFGDPVHIMRTVRELEAAGVAAIYFEDQVFPKRVLYHQGIDTVIPEHEMVAKVKAAVAARRDPDFVLIARTDSMSVEGFDAGIRRANTYLEAGADMAFVYPHSMDEVRRAPREVKGPLVYGVSDGNRKKRPVLTAQELGDLGYKIVFYPTTGLMTAAMNMITMSENLLKSGSTGVGESVFQKIGATI